MKVESPRPTEKFVVLRGSSHDCSIEGHFPNKIEAVRYALWILPQHATIWSGKWFFDKQLGLWDFQPTKKEMSNAEIHFWGELYQQRGHLVETDQSIWTLEKPARKLSPGIVRGFVACIDCTTIFPVIDGDVRCNGFTISMCPWCSDDPESNRAAECRR